MSATAAGIPGGGPRCRVRSCRPPPHPGMVRLTEGSPAGHGYFPSRSPALRFPTSLPARHPSLCALRASAVPPVLRASPKFRLNDPSPPSQHHSPPGKHRSNPGKHRLPARLLPSDRGNIHFPPGNRRFPPARRYFPSAKRRFDQGKLPFPSGKHPLDSGKPCFDSGKRRFDSGKRRFPVPPG